MNDTVRYARAYQKTDVYSGTMYADPHALITQMFDGVLTRIAQAKGAIARDDVAARHHSRFDRGDRQVRKNRFDLLFDQVRRQGVDPPYSAGVLNRDRRDRACPVSAVGLDRLQIGLDPGATG